MLEQTRSRLAYALRRPKTQDLDVANPRRGAPVLYAGVRGSQPGDENGVWTRSSLSDNPPPVRPAIYFKTTGKCVSGC